LFDTRQHFTHKCYSLAYNVKNTLLSTFKNIIEVQVLFSVVVCIQSLFHYWLVICRGVETLTLDFTEIHDLHHACFVETATWCAMVIRINFAVVHGGWTFTVLLPWRGQLHSTMAWCRSANRGVKHKTTMAERYIVCYW